jgi:hypothetical protein
MSGYPRSLGSRLKPRPSIRAGTGERGISKSKISQKSKRLDQISFFSGRLTVARQVSKVQAGRGHFGSHVVGVKSEIRLAAVGGRGWALAVGATSREFRRGTSSPGSAVKLSGCESSGAGAEAECLCEELWQVDRGRAIPVKAGHEISEYHASNLPRPARIPRARFVAPADCLTTSGHPASDSRRVLEGKASLEKARRATTHLTIDSSLGDGCQPHRQACRHGAPQFYPRSIVFLRSRHGWMLSSTRAGSTCSCLTSRRKAKV